MKQLLLISLFLWSLSVSGQSMHQYLIDTKEMVKAGKYQEALERHIWFHEHAVEKEPAMVGVRGSFALADWKALATVYPPALTELRATRDRAVNQIKSDGGNPRLFADVKALNRTLGEPDKTIEVFEMLTTKYPESARSSWHYAKDEIFTAKRYDIARKFVGNPVREYTMLVSNYSRDTTLAKRLPAGREQFVAVSENRFVEKSLQLIDFALASDDLSGAKEIQLAAMKVVKDYRLRDAIPAGKK